MSYVVNDSEDTTDGKMHVWEPTPAPHEEPPEWDCGPSPKSGQPAACGHERDGQIVWRMSRYNNSLKGFLHRQSACEGCVNALVERHGLPDNYRRETEEAR